MAAIPFQTTTPPPFLFPFCYPPNSMMVPGTSFNILIASLQKKKKKKKKKTLHSLFLSYLSKDVSNILVPEI